MSTLMSYDHPVLTSSISLVKRESEPPISSRITASDMVGLTWIFEKDEDLLDELN